MTLGLVFGLILIELIVVSWIDFKTAKISNKWILVNVFFSIVFHVLFKELYPWSPETLIFPVGFVIVGFFLFLMNIMGAGDSKFLASLFLVVPLEYQMIFFERLVISTIVMGGALILIRTIRNTETLKAYFISQHWQGIKDIFKSSFSYAPVIFIAWVHTGVSLWK